MIFLEYYQFIFIVGPVLGRSNIVGYVLSHMFYKEDLIMKAYDVYVRTNNDSQFDYYRTDIADFIVLYEFKEGRKE